MDAVPGRRTLSVSGVAERVAFACACWRSETVHPQRRLYGPWKWRIPSSASLRAAKRCEARWGEAVSASRIRPRPRRGRLSSTDVAPRQAQGRVARGNPSKPALSLSKGRVATPPLTATRNGLPPNPFDAARRDGFAPPRSVQPQKLTEYRQLTRAAPVTKSFT